MRTTTGDEFDVFLSHASEDKAEFVVPLAEELQRRGVRVWIDQQQLQLGDSLRQKIDQGLARSRFGVVVLSPHFFEKPWPAAELDGLAARETSLGVKVILPVWHQVSIDDVTARSPLLASRLAADSAKGIGVVADQIEEVLGGPTASGQLVSSATAPSGPQASELTAAFVHEEVRTLLRNGDAIGLDEVLSRERAAHNRALASENNGEMPTPGVVSAMWTRQCGPWQRRLASLLPLARYDLVRFEAALSRMSVDLTRQPAVDGFTFWQELSRTAMGIIGYQLGAALYELAAYPAVAVLLSAAWTDNHGYTTPLVSLMGEGPHLLGGALAPEGSWTSPIWKALPGMFSAWLADIVPEIDGRLEDALAEFDLAVAAHRGLSDGPGHRTAAWFVFGPNIETHARALHHDPRLRAGLAVAAGVSLVDFDERGPEAIGATAGFQGVRPSATEIATIIRTGSAP